MKNRLPVYTIFRALLSWIYKLWYNPTIIGSENIPDSGKCIIASNHIHILDQCNLIIKTKRYIRYMAKKEYFEGPFSWFFKGVGCICVKRDHQDDEAINTAKYLLLENQCLGIFPEGTRNNLKEEKIKELFEKYLSDTNYSEFLKKAKTIKLSQINYLEELYSKEIITKDELKNNITKVDLFLKELVKEQKISDNDYYDNLLLPLKRGTIKLAYETNSKIIPVAVTGNYKFRSKDLTIRIGKPFNVEENKEKANAQLRKEITNLLKENLNNSGK
ncbi:MAG: 1-acyl-sn-glycerol-3-phosphate acyltransferase [Bacilli bacterium]|nr:1-acyl-sn-glycerol-3-phosphate acyltransferase [Bacilli bacterium]